MTPEQLKLMKKIATSLSKIEERVTVLEKPNTVTPIENSETLTVPLKRNFIHMTIDSATITEIESKQVVERFADLFDKFVVANNIKELTVGYFKDLR